MQTLKQEIGEAGEGSWKAGLSNPQLTFKWLR